MSLNVCTCPGLNTHIEFEYLYAMTNLVTFENIYVLHVLITCVAT